MSKHEGWLELGGLTSLTDAQAESLSKHEGWLCLSGLTSLAFTCAQAESLSKHKDWIDISDRLRQQIDVYKK